MAKYFTIYEFTKSSTASELGIDNTPENDAVYDNILELMRVLDDFREYWTTICKEEEYGNPSIIVNSGYRCKELNEAVGGVETSAHRIGSASDIMPANKKLDEFKKHIKDYLIKNNIDFDQLIFYSNFVHLGLKNKRGEKRKIIFKK